MRRTRVLLVLLLLARAWSCRGAAVDRAVSMARSSSPTDRENEREAEALWRLARACFDRRELQRSQALLHRARELAPRFASAMLHDLALVAHHLGDLDQAARYYAQCDRDTPHFHFDYAVTLERLGRVEAAGREYNRALALDPQLAPAWLNIAALHHQYGDVAMAIPNYERALRSSTATTRVRLMAMTNLGVAFEVSQDILQALHWHEAALQFLPQVDFGDDYDGAPQMTAMAMNAARLDAEMVLRAHAARAKRTACIWQHVTSEFDALLAYVLQHDLAEGRASDKLLPFDTLLYDMDPRARLRIARHHAAQYTTVDHQQQSPNAWLPVDPVRPRLRVGYAAYDYTDHPTAHLLTGVFAAHDRTRVQVLAFSYGRDDASACRRRLQLLADEFVNLVNASTSESIRVMREHDLHILMDAQGHTRGHRARVIAAKPAPIVVNYLVYPGTSGAAYTDYLVADRFVTPAEAMARDFSEKLVLLPASYQANDFGLLALEADARRHLWQVPSTPAMPQSCAVFRFVNFNKIDKLEPGVFAVWMRVLQRVPSSVLILLDPAKRDHAAPTSLEIKRNLALQAAAHGVAPDRLRFVPRVPKQEHLRRHQDADLFLDTFVYGAHSTATDALYAGLPVLTLAGASFASRVGVSLLENVALPELVAHSRKEFEDLAVLLATHPAVLARLTQRLREAEPLQPLFQTQTHTRALEQGMRAMADTARLHGAPMHLLVR